MIGVLDVMTFDRSSLFEYWFPDSISFAFKYWFPDPFSDRG